MLGELFCRGLEDKNVEGNAVDGGLAWKSSEGCLESLSGPSHVSLPWCLCSFGLVFGFWVVAWRFLTEA